MINKDFDFKSTLFDKNHRILKAADFLKGCIVHYSKQLGYATEEWHPTCDNLLEKIKIPESLEPFLIELLKNSKKNVSSKTDTAISCRYYLLSYTRQIINIQTFRLGNGSAQYCGTDYNTTCDI